MSEITEFDVAVLSGNVEEIIRLVQEENINVNQTIGHGIFENCFQEWPLSFSLRTIQSEDDEWVSNFAISSHA